MKKSKSFYGWLFTVVVLSVALAISLYLGISGWFFAADIMTFTDFELGRSTEVGVKSNSSNGFSLYFEGSYLPYETLPQIVGVTNNGDETVYVRAKAFIYTSFNQTEPVGLVNSANWSLQDDGYYYLTSKMTSNSKVGLCTDIFMNGIDLKSKANYIFTVIIEALDEKTDVVALWGVDPVTLQVSQIF